MADIDDALLALAGDASSDEEDEAQIDNNKDSSGSPEARPSGRATAGKKVNRRQNDSEEEGEA